MKTKIYKTYAEFLQREDLCENGVSESFAATHPNFRQENETNIGCWDCSDCSYCSYCSYCSDCSDCIRCRNCSDKKGAFAPPIIPNIHAAVRNAVEANTLEMSTLHICKTSHCRAGWVVHLAGDAGYALESRTSTAFAAMQIYKASSRIRVPMDRFYDDNDAALADINRCAEEESGL